MSLREDVIREIGKVLDLDRCIVFLFGSRAIGKEVDTSDVDVAVHCLYEISDEDFLKLQENLNLNIDIPNRIDLVDMSRADPEFLSFALRGAVVWHVGKDYLRSWISWKEPTRS